jgi:hypothetical protein
MFKVLILTAITILATASLSHPLHAFSIARDLSGLLLAGLGLALAAKRA